jgi:predicted O-linked N-acetylglucosamine transferase (SPINDLY family)
MQDFLTSYSTFLHNVNITQNAPYIYNLAYTAIEKTSDINIKTNILEKLIILFPNDHVLYHNMGNLYKNINQEKQLFWYEICFSIQPEFSENFLDLCEILYMFGLYGRFMDLNKNNLFEKYMKTPRFLTMYVRCKFAGLHYEDGLQVLLDLIKMNSKKLCVTEYDKYDKWRNYHDAGYVFCAKCDIENSLKYTQKALDLSVKFNFSLDRKMLSFQNLLCFNSYYYADNAKLFKTYLKINDFLPDKPNDLSKRKPNKKIKIGYISSDFITHAVSNFILPIIKHHNTNTFEIFLFANSQEVDDMYKKLKGIKIHIISTMKSKEAAELINRLNIDILFDLNGHTVNNRLEIFTYHPAPIQFAYLGYPNTTGLKSIQYRFTDAIANHTDSNEQYTETLVYLPKCFLLFDSIHNFSEKAKPTIPNKIILGAINKENKTNKEVLSVWKTILERCPNAVILIKLESFDNKKERTEFYKKQLNCDDSQIIVLNKLHNGEYEKIFNQFDILLDTFPYSGTTTSCNTLLHSIPIVTLYHKDYHAHNVSSSIIINCGYPELVAKSKEEYINIVTYLVNHPEKIDFYKKTIRNSFLELMRPEPFMKTYEAELLRIYSGKPSSPVVSDRSLSTDVKTNILLESKTDKAENLDNVKTNILLESKTDKAENLDNDKTNNSIQIDIFEKNKIISTSSPNQSKKVYICGCVKNVALFLEKIFINIDKLISLFDDYEIVIAYDTNEDNTIDILKQKKQTYNITLLNVIENYYITDYTMRSQRISNARNEIIKYIRMENRDDFQYFIMMDMDDMCSVKMNKEVLNDYLLYNTEWDALSFNRTEYYDIWALSIDSYVFSCWHFPGGFSIVNEMKKYITAKLKSLKPDELLKCFSAFNGFAIYKKDKFTNCQYEWSIQSNYEMIPLENIEKNEKVLGEKITLEKAYHPIIHPKTDCEHRAFHMMAITLNDAKIRISPKILFIN